MIGVASKSIVDATNNLAAHAVGMKKGNLDAVKERLIVLGIEKCQSNGAAIPSNKHADSFAAKVAEIASKLSTPPFQGRVAIAQVYDQYGKIFPDAGSSRPSRNDSLVRQKTGTFNLVVWICLSEWQTTSANAVKQNGIEKKCIS